MNDKLPRTPFSTPLSGSAKETELRLKNIFSGPKKRPPVLFLVLMFSVCLFCGSTFFSGDTLFLHDCGRTDLYGGSFPEICDSLRRLAALPEDYTVRPGHGEMTSIDEERGWIAVLLEKYR